jgi:hypothetical protein
MPASMRAAGANSCKCVEELQAFSTKKCFLSIDVFWSSAKWSFHFSPFQFHFSATAEMKTIKCDDACRSIYIHLSLSVSPPAGTKFFIEFK